MLAGWRAGRTWRRFPAIALLLASFWLGLTLAVAQPFAQAAPAPAPRDLGYLTPEELAAGYAQLQAAYPDLVTVERIGETWETSAGLADRPIWALRLRGKTGTSGDRPVVAFVGGQHAREVATIDLLYRFAWHLAGRYHADPEIAHWLDTRDVWIVPLSNPDGYQRVLDGQEAWRKNTNPTHNHPDDWRLALPYGIGVDLNRNFGLHWGEGGASTWPAGATYQGPAPFSETETQALRDWLLRVRPAILLAYHSPLAAVIWPWGHTADAAPDAALLSAIGGRLAAYPGYQARQTQHLVGTTTGDIADWAYEALGTLAFGVELDGGFIPDAADRDRIWAANRDALRYAVALAGRPAEGFGPVGSTPAITATSGVADLSLTFSVLTGMVAAAEYTLDPAVPPGEGTPLIALDGAFDSASERVTGRIEGVPGDVTTVSLRARNSAGAWGPATRARVSVSPVQVYLPRMALTPPP